VTRTKRWAAGIGGLLVAAAVGVTAAAASGSFAISAVPVAAVSTTAPGAPASASGPYASGQSGSLAGWAAALGVDEATLRTALAGARDDVRAQRPQPPATGAKAKPGAMRAAMVQALAARLGKPESQIRQTFQAFLAAHQAGSRDALVQRLDAAVAAGRLTDAERAAVLTAYDAGVLGRGSGAAGRMGHLGGPGPRAASPTR